MIPRVYLADLRHDYSGVLAIDTMPLGVSYMKAVIDRDLPDVQARVFAYPDRLLTSIRETPPAVLMLTNYAWNEALSLHVAQVAKAIRPGTLVVMGGPNVPLEDERRIAFVAEHRALDVYILGEGDFQAAEIVRRFLDAGTSIARFAAGEIPSSVYRRPDGTVTLQAVSPRHRRIDDIPSPWLTGIQDEFFDVRLAPMLQTNRGCPFTCTFCVEGTSWYTKVHNFSVERVKAEIEHIARRIHDLCPWVGALVLTDSNYGMFDRDVELSEFMGEMIRRYGYPKHINATTGKNRPDRIIRSVEAASGALVVYQSVQSLSENVLRNIKRSNISLDAYGKLIVEMQDRGLRSSSELILGLPGETLESHLESLHRLIDMGVDAVTNYQLMLLKGSELEMLDARQRFAFQSRFRVVPKNFGVYDGSMVFDVEEIVVATKHLSFDDYLRARLYALACVFFWHGAQFVSAVTLAERLGFRKSEVFEALVARLRSAGGRVGALRDGFLTETRNELFMTREGTIKLRLGVAQ